jgi:hypothetical protein
MSPEMESFYRQQSNAPGSLGGFTFQQLLSEIDQLRDTINSMAERIAQQSELLSKRAEKKEHVDGGDDES